MDISTFWIQILSYIASAVAGFVSAYIASHYVDMPTAGSSGIGIAIIYFVHHYLDGLLNKHNAAIASLSGSAGSGATDNSSSGNASAVLPPPAVTDLPPGTNAVPGGATIYAENVHIGGPVARSATEDGGAISSDPAAPTPAAA